MAIDTSALPKGAQVVYNKYAPNGYWITYEGRIFNDPHELNQYLQQQQSTQPTSNGLTKEEQDAINQIKNDPNLSESQKNYLIKKIEQISAAGGRSTATPTNNGQVEVTNTQQLGAYDLRGLQTYVYNVNGQNVKAFGTWENGKFVPKYFTLQSGPNQNGMWTVGTGLNVDINTASGTIVQSYTEQSFTQPQPQPTSTQVQIKLPEGVYTASGKEYVTAIQQNGQWVLGETEAYTNFAGQSILGNLNLNANNNILSLSFSPKPQTLQPTQALFNTLGIGDTRIQKLITNFELIQQGNQMVIKPVLKAEELAQSSRIQGSQELFESVYNSMQTNQVGTPYLLPFSIPQNSIPYYTLTPSNLGKDFYSLNINFKPSPLASSTKIAQPSYNFNQPISLTNVWIPNTDVFPLVSSKSAFMYEYGIKPTNLNEQVGTFVYGQVKFASETANAIYSPSSTVTQRVTGLGEVALIALPFASFSVESAAVLSFVSGAGVSATHSIITGKQPNPANMLVAGTISAGLGAAFYSLGSELSHSAVNYNKLKVAGITDTEEGSQITEVYQTTEVGRALFNKIPLPSVKTTDIYTTGQLENGVSYTIRDFYGPGVIHFSASELTGETGTAVFTTSFKGTVIEKILGSGSISKGIWFEGWKGYTAETTGEFVPGWTVSKGIFAQSGFQTIDVITKTTGAFKYITIPAESGNLQLGTGIYKGIPVEFKVLNLVSTPSGSASAVVGSAGVNTITSAIEYTGAGGVQMFEGMLRSPPSTTIQPPLQITGASLSKAVTTAQSITTAQITGTLSLPTLSIISSSLLPQQTQQLPKTITQQLPSQVLPQFQSKTNMMQLPQLVSTQVPQSKITQFNLPLPTATSFNLAPTLNDFFASQFKITEINLPKQTNIKSFSFSSIRALQNTQTNFNSQNIDFKLPQITIPIQTQNIIQSTFDNNNNPPPPPPGEDHNKLPHLPNPFKFREYDFGGNVFKNIMPKFVYNPDVTSSMLNIYGSKTMLGIFRPIPKGKGGRKR
jgi:hypothetical protein